MVDSDFYCPKRTDIKELDNKLEYLHKRATRLIRWIISNKLHKIMESQTL